MNTSLRAAAQTVVVKLFSRKFALACLAIAGTLREAQSGDAQTIAVALIAVAYAAAEAFVDRGRLASTVGAGVRLGQTATGAAEPIAPATLTLRVDTPEARDLVDLVDADGQSVVPSGAIWTTTPNGHELTVEVPR